MWHFKPCNFEHPKHGEQLSACIVHTLHFVSVSNPFSLHSIVAQTMVCILSSLGQMSEGVETGSLKKPAAALTAKEEPTHDGAAGAVGVDPLLAEAKRVSPAKAAPAKPAAAPKGIAKTGRAPQAVPKPGKATVPRGPPKSKL